MKPYTSFERVLVCLTMTFLIIIAYDKIINITNIKSVKITDTTPLIFTKIENSLEPPPKTQLTDKTTAVKNKSNQVTDIQKVININTATVSELMQISGIGEVLAQRIIDFRIENGSFQALEELMLVKGIGEATYEKIKTYVCLQKNFFKYSFWYRKDYL